MKDLVSKICKSSHRQRKILLRSCKVKLHSEISLVSDKSASKIFTKIWPDEDLLSDYLVVCIGRRIHWVYVNLYLSSASECLQIALCIFLDYFFVLGRSCRTRLTIERRLLSNGLLDTRLTADYNDLLICYSRIFRIWILKWKLFRKYFNLILVWNISKRRWE